MLPPQAALAIFSPLLKSLVYIIRYFATTLPILRLREFLSRKFYLGKFRVLNSFLVLSLFSGEFREIFAIGNMKKFREGTLADFPKPPPLRFPEAFKNKGFQRIIEKMYIFSIIIFIYYIV